jgi:lysophospholipase L1-like esterase
MRTHGSAPAHRFATLLLPVVSVALVLVAAELLARATDPAPARPAPHPPAPAGDDVPVLESLGEIYNRRNVRGTWRGVFVRTNSFSLRGPEYTRTPPPGVFRIAIGGDSFTMGLGVDEADTYPAQLERLLADDGRPPPVQVINAGLSGININNAVGRLGQAAELYHPHLLVLGFTSNDIEGRHYRKLASGAVDAAIDAARWRFKRSQSHLLRRLWPRWVSLREALSPSPGSYLDELETNYFENPAAWDDVRLGLDRLAQLARERGRCAHLLLHTSLGELGWIHPERRIYERVAAAARERGVSVTESFPYFRGRRAASLWVRPGDPHPNAAGNAILARALRDGLRALPPTCWRLEAPAGEV